MVEPLGSVCFKVTSLPYPAAFPALIATPSPMAYIGVHSELVISIHSCDPFVFARQSEYVHPRKTE